MLTEGNQVDIGRYSATWTVYETMQPVPEPPCPSASMGAEWMGSESEALDVTVKRVAKESIVVSVYELCGSRDG